MAYTHHNDAMTSAHNTIQHLCTKLAVRGDTGAGSLVAPLPCSAYFGKLAVLFG